MPKLASLLEMGLTLDKLTWDLRDAVHTLDGLDLDENEAREFQLLMHCQSLLDVATGIYPYWEE